MIADNGRANLASACALVDEFARQGVRHAIVCPGSRSTPIAVALAAHPDLRVWVHIDERSAAYFALGMARQLGEPVLLLSTSGTAAANFLPAVAEASLSRIPLVVLTADRPPELRDWGAAQTIDQIRLYGSHAKWFVDLPVPTDDDSLLRFTRATATRAVHTARSAPAGPIHLNLPFREPLLPSDLSPPLQLEPWFAAGRGRSPDATRVGPTPARVIPTKEESSLDGSRVAVTHELQSESAVADIAPLIRDEPRGLIVCGPGESPSMASAATALAAASGYPILADPLSGVRFGPHDHANVLDAYDPLLRDQRTAERLQPNLVIRVGAPPTSKPLQHFLMASDDAAHVVIDSGPLRDPSHLATHYVHGDVSATLSAIAKTIACGTSRAESQWLAMWRSADHVAGSAITQALADEAVLSEGGVAADIAALLPGGATLVIGNSMPIRDVDAFVRGDERCLRLLGNRGANGIDGMSSTALGAAAVADGPVALLLGDLSFLHDIGGLMASRLFAISAAIVVVNNNGGGIFSFLPQAEQLDAATFEALFGTPANVDVGAAARLFGGSHSRPDSPCAFRREFARALAEPGLSIVEVVTDRAKNVARHREVWAAVANALHQERPDGG